MSCIWLVVWFYVKKSVFLTQKVLWDTAEKSSKETNLKSHPEIYLVP